MRIRTEPIALASAAAAALAALPAAAQDVVEVTVVAQEGAPVAGAGGLVGNSFNSATSTPSGTLTFTGSVTDGTITDNFVWNGSMVALLNGSITGEVVTGAESRSGGSDAGDFLYSPSTDGNDSVRNASGLVLAETQVAPGLEPQFITFCSRPTMNAAGTAYWISGINATDPNGSTEFRVLYAFDGTDYQILRQAGDVLSFGEQDFTVSFGSGVDFDYAVSPDGTNLIQTLDMAEATPADDFFVAVNDVLVAREGDPNGSGVDNWDNFDAVVINDAGDYAFTGDTDGDTALDEFIAWNGSIVLRQGDTVDGITIGSGDSIRGIALNNQGQLCHAWGSFSGGEYVFLGDGSDLPGTSTKVIATGDLVDVDGDGFGDFEVVDLENSTIDGGQIGLDDAGNVTVQISVVSVKGGDELEMIATIATGGAPCTGDLDGNGEVGFGDLTVVLAAWGSMGGAADLDGSGEVGFGDLTVLLAAWGPCP